MVFSETAGDFESMLGNRNASQIIHDLPRLFKWTRNSGLMWIVPPCKTPIRRTQKHDCSALCCLASGLESAYLMRMIKDLRCNSQFEWKVENFRCC